MNFIGVMILVEKAADELDESGLSDTTVLGAVYGMSKAAVDRRLESMVNDYVEDHGLPAKGTEIRLSVTAHVRSY